MRVRLRHAQTVAFVWMTAKAEFSATANLVLKATDAKSTSTTALAISALPTPFASTVLTVTPVGANSLLLVRFFAVC